MRYILGNFVNINFIIQILSIFLRRLLSIILSKKSLLSIKYFLFYI